MNSKLIRAALVAGIDDGAQLSNQGELPKLHSYVGEALATSREKLHDVCEQEGTADRAHALGKVVAHVLTDPALKIGERRKSATIQLVTELANHCLGNETLEVTTALGGSEDAPSVRLISYISPLLEIGSVFAAADMVPPRMRVVAAHAVSSTLNGLDAEIATRRANQASTLICNLATLFYPECVQQLEIEALTMEELRAVGHSEDTEHLLKLIHSKEQDEPVQASLQKLLGRATKKHASHLNEEQHAQILAGYGAAHGLSFHNYRFPHVKSAIKIGGQGEAPFDVIQQHMTDRAAEHGEHVVNTSSGSPILVNLRSRAGTIPPYHLEGAAEITADTPPDQMPLLSEAIQHYHAAGLRSGEDLSHLPERLQTEPQLLRLILGSIV